MNTTTDNPNTSGTQGLNFKKPVFWIVFFEILFFIQLALIFIFNLTHLKYEAGFDSSAAMAQAMEVWNQKTIFIKNWNYQATLGLDSVLIPASILYGITHNIFLAYGIADCLGVILYIYVFRDILKTLGASKLSRMIAYVILLTPYSLEPLGYMPMMFTGAAYYIIKVLIPIMLVDIMLKLHNKTPFKKYIPLLIIYFISLYMTGLSCGLYIFICGIVPIIIYELFYAIGSGHLKNLLNNELLFIGISLFIYALGFISGKIYGADAFTNAMTLCQVNDFTSNFFKCIVGIAELFGAIPSQEIVVTSLFGIHYLSHMAAFILYIIILLTTIKKAKPFSSLIITNSSDINDPEKSKNTTNQTVMVIGMVACIIIVNLAVLILTNTTYGSESFEFRYHLIPVVAGFLIVCIGIHHLTEWFHKNGNHLLSHTILAIIGCVWILCNCVFAYYFSITNSYDTSLHLLSVIKDELHCERAYFVGDDDTLIETARIMRLSDPDIIINDGTIIGNYRGWGASTAHDDPIEVFDKLLIICKKGDYENFEDRYKSVSKLLKIVDGYYMYEIRPSEIDLFEDDSDEPDYDELNSDETVSDENNSTEHDSITADTSDKKSADTLSK